MLGSAGAVKLAVSQAPAEEGPSVSLLLPYCPISCIPPPPYVLVFSSLVMIGCVMTARTRMLRSGRGGPGVAVLARLIPAQAFKGAGLDLEGKLMCGTLRTPYTPTTHSHRLHAVQLVDEWRNMFGTPVDWDRSAVVTEGPCPSGG